MGGFVMLGVAAVAAVVGLVSLAGGGDRANAAPPPPSVNAAASTAPVSPSPSPAAKPEAAPAPAPEPAPAPAPAPAPIAAPPPATPAPAPAPAPAPSPAPAPAPAPNAAPAPAPKIAPAPAAPKPLPGAGLPADNGAGTGRSGGSGATHAPRKVVKAPVRVYNNSRIRDLAQRAAADFRDSGWQVTEVGNYPFGAIGTSTVYYEPGNARELSAAQSLASSFGMRAAPRFGGIANATPGLIVIITRDYQRR
jgi:hypothetical protein